VWPSPKGPHDTKWGHPTIGAVGCRLGEPKVGHFSREGGVQEEIFEALRSLWMTQGLALSHAQVCHALGGTH